jgi:proteasome lid subunit RPN8/RPN11
MIDDDIRAAIKAHALEEPTKEVCGYIITSGKKLRVLRSKNTAEIPERYFRLDPNEYLSLIESGDLKAFYHSHPETNEEPTMPDKEYSEELELPSIIYSLPRDEFSFYEPCGYQAPLEGRMYVPLLFDCVALVADYIKRETGIQLTELTRKLEDIEAGISFSPTYCELNNMRLVTGQPLEKYDVVLMQIGQKAKAPNHVAVYTGGGNILHQVINRVSCTVVFHGYWKDRTLYVYRLKNLPKV